MIKDYKQRKKKTQNSKLKLNIDMRRTRTQELAISTPPNLALHYLLALPACLPANIKENVRN